LDEKMGNGKSSKVEETKTTITITKHVCAQCGRLRSRRYHHRNPIKTGEMPAPAYCRKCQKDASSTSGDTDVESKKRKKVKNSSKGKEKEKENNNDKDKDKGGKGKKQVCTIFHLGSILLNICIRSLQRVLTTTLMMTPKEVEFLQTHISLQIPKPRSTRHRRQMKRTKRPNRTHLKITSLSRKKSQRITSLNGAEINSDSRSKLPAKNAWIPALASCPFESKR
jgi:hypothetical protein